LPEAKKTLDAVKLKYDLPSYTQAVTLLAQQERFREEFVKTATPEITRTIVTELYRFFFDLVNKLEKPPDQITLKDLVGGLASIESVAARK